VLVLDAHPIEVLRLMISAPIGYPLGYGIRSARVTLRGVARCATTERVVCSVP